MTNQDHTIDTQEIAKFAQHASSWWDKEGPFKTLHDINLTRLQFILEYQTLAKKTALDVGCGGGILTEALAKQGAYVTGLDVEKQALEAAKIHAQQGQLTINYVLCPIELFEPLATFDVIVCMEMLEHVQQPEWIIKHCTRLLKPGGYLFLSTINRTLKAYLGAVLAAEYLLNLLPRQTHDFKKFIKPSELTRLIRANDLELVGLTGMSYNPFSRLAALQSNVDVDYLLACRRPF